MLYQRCVHPRHCLAGVSDKLGLRPARIHRQLFTRRYCTDDCATELRRLVRNSLVVPKPACTPVPPVRNGNAAGDAGLAPPASALSEMATRFPAAGGFHHFASKAQPPLSNVFQSLRAPFRLAGPRAASGRGSPAQAQFPGWNAVSARSAAWRQSAQSGPGHQSRVPGTG